MKRGFTLLELLIVIAIIGILISIGVVSYSSAQRKSRDARRSADLKGVQNAWEQYYADNSGRYPGSCAISTTYLPAGLPTDPKTGSAYASTCTNSTYCFCGAIEVSGANANSSCNYAAGTKTHFCVSNLQ